jgi:hypothetical protein
MLYETFSTCFNIKFVHKFSNLFIIFQLIYYLFIYNYCTYLGITLLCSFTYNLSLNKPQEMIYLAENSEPI